VACPEKGKVVGCKGSGEMKTKGGGINKGVAPTAKRRETNTKGGEKSKREYIW